MTSDRDQLAELIGSVRADEPDPLTYCDCPDPQQLADAILAAGWHKAHLICAPDKHVMYEHCGMCGESPEAVEEDLALLRTALARIERAREGQ